MEICRKRQFSIALYDGQNALFKSGIEKGHLFDGIDLTNKQTPETSYIILGKLTLFSSLKKGAFFAFTANGGKNGVQIRPVTRIARKYPFSATRNFEKNKAATLWYSKLCA